MRPCADGDPPGDPCPAAPRDRVNVRFAIRDDDGALDGVNAMSFAISLTCSGRNC
jgi:hypothetical protein